MPLPSSPFPRLPYEVLWRVSLPFCLPLGVSLLFSNQSLPRDLSKIAFFSTWDAARVITECLPRLIKPVTLFGRREEPPHIEFGEPRYAPFLTISPPDFDHEGFFENLSNVWSGREVRQVPYRPAASSSLLEFGFLEIRRDLRNDFLPLTLTRLLSPLGYVLAWSLRAGDWINIEWHPLAANCTCNWSCFSSHGIHEPCNHEPTRDVPWATVNPVASADPQPALRPPTAKLMRAVRNDEYGVIRFSELTRNAQTLYAHFVEIVGWWDHLPQLTKIHLAANFYSLNRDLGFCEFEALDISEVPQTLGTDYMRT